MDSCRQLWVNYKVLTMRDVMQNVVDNGALLSMKRLRNCKAWVYCFADAQGRKYYILRSSSTFVAGITPIGTALDWSRYVYCDMATTAKHIAKFFNDYAPKDGLMFRYYPL